MNNKQISFSLKELYRQGGRELKQSGIENYIMEAELLLADLLNVSKEYLLSHSDEEVDSNICERYKNTILKRKDGVPLAYLIGYKEFYNLKFRVNENVLIPRPETELIVEEVLKYFNSLNIPCENIAMADVGTGSGCIPISLLKNINKRVGKVFCSDISQDVLKTAYLNAVDHNVENCIKFLYGYFILPFFSELKEIKKYSELIITANLPYVSKEKYNNSASIQKEPKLALLGTEPEGLGAYKILLHQLYRLSSKIESKIVIFCELDDDQIISFENMVVNTFPFYRLIFKKDLKDNYRLAILELNS
jgi:release factor glutamine methyltransferase